MSAPKFNNTPNNNFRFRYQTEHGVISNDIWISRSVAVVGVVFAINKDLKTFVLITKRSAKMVDEANKYCVPCGYLDWDETTFQAMNREVYEETSFYLPDESKSLIFNNNEQPFKIQDKPEKDARQNVSFIFVNVYKYDALTPPLDILNFKDKETAEVIWMSIADFNANKLEWAFHHDETIKSALDFCNNTLICI